MGLDMYAARRFYVKNWDHMPEGERYSVQVAWKDKPIPCLQPERISDVDEEVMCWRKANHIHAWFVDNVQRGSDDCKSYYVEWKLLRQLLHVCEDVIEASELVEGTVDAGTVYDKDHPKGIAMREPGKVIKDATVASELLPTRSGFFFGSLEYDERYLKKVKDTRDWIKRMLSDYEAGCPGDIYYSSSW